MIAATPTAIRPRSIVITFVRRHRGSNTTSRGRRASSFLWCTCLVPCTRLIGLETGLYHHVAYRITAHRRRRRAFLSRCVRLAVLRRFLQRRDEWFGVGRIGSDLTACLSEQSQRAFLRIELQHTNTSFVNKEKLNGVRFKCKLETGNRG